MNKIWMFEEELNFTMNETMIYSQPLKRDGASWEAIFFVNQAGGSKRLISCY